MTRPHPKSTLFPYTTLFRSRDDSDPGKVLGTRATADFPAAHKQSDFPAGTLSGRRAVVSRSAGAERGPAGPGPDRKSTRLNSSHRCISYAVFCLKKKNAEKRSSNLRFHQKPTIKSLRSFSRAQPFLPNSHVIICSTSLLPRLLIRVYNSLQSHPL